MCRFIMILIIGISIISCETKEVKYFRLTVHTTYDPALVDRKVLPFLYQEVFDYYLTSISNDTCSKYLFVPEIIIKRIDFNPSRAEDFIVPLSTENNIRKRLLKNISASNLMADYDEVIPMLPIPNLLKEKGNSNMYDIVPTGTIILDNSTDVDIDEFKAKIVQELCHNKTNNGISVLIKNDEETPPERDSIEYIIGTLIDLTRSDEERSADIDNIISHYFTEGATIEEFGMNKTRVGLARPVKIYFDNIIRFRTIDRIEVIEAKKDVDGKYWTVKVIEHHNTVN